MIDVGEFEEKFRKLLNLYEKVGQEYASAKAQSWHLQEMKSPMFSAELLGAEGGTVGEREAKAKTSNAYLTHLEGTRVAIENELKLKVKLERIQMSYEALRSLASQTTASLRFGG